MTEPAARIKLFWDGTAGFGNFGIGADYFFSQSDTTLLAGLDLGYGTSVVQGTPPANITSTTDGAGDSGIELRTL